MCRVGKGAADAQLGMVISDGLDDIFCGYPICYWRADGRTGEVLFFNNPGDVLPGWPAYPSFPDRQVKSRPR